MNSPVLCTFTVKKDWFTAKVHVTPNNFHGRVDPSIETEVFRLCGIRSSAAAAAAGADDDDGDDDADAAAAAAAERSVHLMIRPRF